MQGIPTKTAESGIALGGKEKPVEIPLSKHDIELISKPLNA